MGIRSRKKKSISNLSFHTLTAIKKGLWVFLPYLLSLTLAGVLFGGVVAYAVNSPVFELQEVHILNMGTVPQAEAFRFCELQRGENLITLDLVNVQQVIKRKHPQFKEVLIRRVLPNRIEVMLKRRTPEIQILFSKYIQVDKDLVILPGSSSTPFRNLTIIEGTPVPSPGIYVGVTIKDPATQQARKLAEEIKRLNMLGKHTLSKVDIRDPKNFCLIVDNEIEIKMGDNHFVERLKILAQTLKTMDLDKTKIRYIDLRFDDVIIGPR